MEARAWPPLQVCAQRAGRPEGAAGQGGPICAGGRAQHQVRPCARCGASPTPCLRPQTRPGRRQGLCRQGRPGGRCTCPAGLRASKPLEECFAVRCTLSYYPIPPIPKKHLQNCLTHPGTPRSLWTSGRRRSRCATKPIKSKRCCLRCQPEAQRRQQGNEGAMATQQLALRFFWP